MDGLGSIGILYPSAGERRDPNLREVGVKRVTGLLLAGFTPSLAGQDVMYSL